MIKDCTTTEHKGLSNKLHTRIFAIFFVYTVAHLYNNLWNGQIDELKVIETGHTTRNCFQTPLRPRHSYIIPTLTADIWRSTTKNRLRPPPVSMSRYSLLFIGRRTVNLCSEEVPDVPVLILVESYCPTGEILILLSDYTQYRLCSTHRIERTIYNYTIFKR